MSAYARTLRDATPNAKRYLAAVVLQNIAIGLLGTVFALYVKSVGMSTSVVGDTEGALSLAAAVVCLLLPPLVSVVGYRALLITAAVAFGLSRLGQTLDIGPSLMVAFGLAYGIGDGIVRSIGVAFLSESGPGGSNRTLLFTVDFVLRVVAAFVGALIGGLLPEALSFAMPEAQAFRISMALAGIVLLSSAIPVLGIRDERRLEGHPWTRYVRTVRGFRSWDRLARLAGPQLMISVGAGLIMPFVPLFLRTHLGASVAQIGMIQGTTAIVMAAATLLTPLLARRLGLVGTVVATELASLPFLLVIPLASGLPVVAVAMWARSSLMNMSWPVYNQISVEGIPARDRPLIAGWTNVAWSVAWLAGSVIGGRLAETSYTTGYFITAGLYAVGAVTSWLLLRHLEAPAAAEQSGAATA
ncbi:MAG: hypothetical protein CVT60_05845 [Actinobacteria bacterium HGW-Actinobacteria-10]|nr:MAG: hypothetical protein CVT60_05845 [Actinobacteria bacterium HGW-Actinobacteria-10]